MQCLLDFLNNENSKIKDIIKCNNDEALILRHMCKIYLRGSSQSSVYDILNEIYGNKNFAHLAHLKDIKSLLDLGWIVQNFSIFKANENVFKFTQNSSLLELLYAEISLSQLFLKLLEEGNVVYDVPKLCAYENHLEYLKDQFCLIDLYQKLSTLPENTDAKKLIFSHICELEKRISEKLEITKITISVEQIFKENSLNKKEKIIFLALLKDEYSPQNDSFGDMNSLLSLVSANELEKMKNRSLLDEDSALIRNELIEYDEILNTFGNISRSFFITEDTLQLIMRPQNKQKNKKLKLQSIVKEQEIFELIEPKTDINDVVLNSKTKELLENILKQVDKKVIARLNFWGIKKTKSVDVKVIFYGPAGTGKTMSAISLAKSLKKQVLSFDCSKILSKYVGESEQNVRKIFDTYKEICEKSGSEPVLLLNEADQFLSMRIDGGTSGADKMHNQMQNIFLEQIERFEGILIATTNFLQSLDSAFSRRFDYKIEFKKPNFDERLIIWQKILPENADFEENFDVNILANFELSGAQIILVLKNTALKVAIRDSGIFMMSDFIDEIKREISSAFDNEKKVGLL